jgi:general secretion pathway protein C
VRPDSLYKAIGLQSGDMISRVNGQNIDTPNRAIQLFEELRSSSNIAVDIERRGKKITLSYQIK